MDLHKNFLLVSSLRACNKRPLSRTWHPARGHELFTWICGSYISRWCTYSEYNWNNNNQREHVKKLRRRFYSTCNDGIAGDMQIKDAAGSCGCWHVVAHRLLQLEPKWFTARSWSTTTASDVRCSSLCSLPSVVGSCHWPHADLYWSTSNFVQTHFRRWCNPWTYVKIVWSICSC